MWRVGGAGRLPVARRASAGEDQLLLRGKLVLVEDTGLLEPPEPLELLEALVLCRPARGTALRLCHHARGRGGERRPPRGAALAGPGEAAPGALAHALVRLGHVGVR